MGGKGEKKKKAAPSPGGPPQGPTGPQKCTAQGCSAKEKRYGFCAEHFDHFKFGLICKDGSKVQDYEKKFEHYQRYTERKGVQKAA